MYGVFMKNYKYTVLLERNDDAGYTVTVPALKGCVTQADSIAEALSCAKEAIECHIESLHLLRKHIPADCKMIRVNAVELNEAMIFKVIAKPEFDPIGALVKSA